MKDRVTRWLGIVVVAASASLLFSVARSGANQPGQEPFRNAVEQREEMIKELQEIKGLIRDQNALLRELLVKKSKS